MKGAGGKPSQARLRRAVSTAYYAVFHAMAANCANMLIGSTKGTRSKHAWVEVYRSLAHGSAKSACEYKAVIEKFPDAIIDFAQTFVVMQEMRHDADYNPYARFAKSSVIADIDRCDVAISQFRDASLKDRTAFASWVLLRNAKRN